MRLNNDIRITSMSWCWHWSINPCSSCFLLLHCEWRHCRKRQKSSLPLQADVESFKPLLDLILELQAPKAAPQGIVGVEPQHLEDLPNELGEQVFTWIRASLFSVLASGLSKSIHELTCNIPAFKWGKHHRDLYQTLTDADRRGCRLLICLRPSAGLIYNLQII